MIILQFPLARIGLFFILGLLLYQKGFQPKGFVVFIFLFVGLVGLVTMHRYANKRNAFKSFGWLVALLSVALGLSTAAFHQDTRSRLHYSHLTEDQVPYHFQVTLHEKLKSTKKNQRYVAIIKSINHRKSLGKILLNIRHSSQNTNIPIGSHLAVDGLLYHNKAPFNPNQFDYSGYLENQQIYAQIYTIWPKLKIITTENTIWSKFSNFRTKIIDNLKKSNFNETELAVMIALLLGQQQDIDPETLQEYQLAGAVHILSVSGLHVGFIMLFINFLLKPIPNTSRNNYIKLLIIVLALWSYGILAGLAPSVVRSVTMFSFVAVGQHLRRSVNVYHSLLVSVLLILLWKPSFLFDVGFQLSYLALFFILWLQPLIADFWQPKHKITRYIWDILTVSLAAQLGTLPLSIYYFHQFPGLFFVTNVLVLPLLGIIMVFGLVAVIIGCFGIVPKFVIVPLTMMIAIQNKCIGWVASWDALVFKNIGFTAAMLWTSYLVIIALGLWLQKPIYKKAVLIMVSVLLLQIVCLHNKWQSTNTQEMIVYHQKKSTMITERKNNKVILFGNDSIQNTIAKNQILQSYLTANFAKLTHRENLQNLYYFNTKKILLIDSSTAVPINIKPDIVILVNSPKINLERYLSAYTPKQIVADGSNYKSYIRLWKATCHKAKIPFHITNEKGFYKI
ncbi:MAG: competence protein ComEC [Flavobacterium sp.]|uniref:ComEC/Rec2 family competence protein n=1 Tax=Flavobacterium sp. TaxID=239 RepID=UPI0025BEC302|nr:ComEC/Rec2 family competence protein [Flavobacterium sp.]MBA4133450.1 competence protein ComEC [Flavobacterium sp.]